MRQLVRGRRWFLDAPQGAFRQYQFRRRRRYTVGDFTTFDGGGETPPIPTGPFPWDDVEDYTDQVVVSNTLNLGENGPIFSWTTPYDGGDSALGVHPFDNAESYSNGASVTGLNGGSQWNGAWVADVAYFGVAARDTVESYGSGVNVDGLNGGEGIWNGAYVVDVSYVGIMATDNAESYSASGTVAGLNGGTGFWNGVWVVH